jgi:sortase A
VVNHQGAAGIRPPGDDRIAAAGFLVVAAKRLLVDPLSTPPPGHPVLSRARRLLTTRRGRFTSVVTALALLGASTSFLVRSAQAEGEPVAPAAVPETVVPIAVAPEPEVPVESEEFETEATPPTTTGPGVAPRKPAPVTQLGEIRIAKIGLVHPIYEGVSLDVVDHGPGHWPGSAVPGQLGNAVFAGHRVTHSHPFRNLDQLVPGDEVVFTTTHGTFTYRVTDLQVVSNKDTWIIKPTPEATLTLFACHPPGSAKQRIVARGILISSAIPAS